jgi:hypothetical protein
MHLPTTTRAKAAGDEALNAGNYWPSLDEHSLVEAAVTEASRELQVAREMALMCAFGAMATACQRHVDVQMPTGHTVPTSLMLLTIADSGERKTTTQKHFFQAITELNDAAHRASETASVEHRVEHQLWTTQKRHLERMYSKHAAQEDESSALAALEKVAEHVRAEPTPARSGKFLYEDTTPQALVQMLYENAPDGCVLTSEANSIFSGKALGELDKLNTLWDGSSVIVDRISREGFVLQNARLTLSLMAQPSVISRFMAKRGEEARGTGFLARFLIVKPRLMAGQRTDKKLSELLRLRKFNTRIHELLSAPLLTERQVLSFSEQAKDRWFQYSHFLEMQMKENGLYCYLKDHASKVLENTSRLAAIVHTFERSSNNNTEIDCSTLEFCWNFTQQCSKHFRDHLANEPQIVIDANQLAHYLLKLAEKQDIFALKKGERHSGGSSNDTRPSELPRDLIYGVKATFTITLIKQFGPSSLRGRANTARLEGAIDLLCKLGHIKKEGSRYRFQESILLRQEPELKNGEIIEVKELPLFSEQEFWTPQRGLGPTAGYYIKVR